jgi:hypothetical protein
MKSYSDALYQHKISFKYSSKMNNICLLCSAACFLVVTSGQQYHGILINGWYGGTQLYDPFNSPHSLGDLQLGLPTGDAAIEGAAVINGPLAYFSSGYKGMYWNSLAVILRRAIIVCLQLDIEHNHKTKPHATIPIRLWYDHAGQWRRARVRWLQPGQRPVFFNLCTVMENGQ